MAHWIIEDHGFGGQTYRCSNCRDSWNDIYEDVSFKVYCPNCGEPINEDESEYIESYNSMNSKLVFPHTIGSITYYSAEELIEWVEKQQELMKKNIKT